MAIGGRICHHRWRHVCRSVAIGGNRKWSFVAIGVAITAVAIGGHLLSPPAHIGAISG